MVHSCIYRSKKERCLIGDSYPITKNNKISRKRIKAAEIYGKRYRDWKKLKRTGICKIAKRKGLKLKDC